VETAVVILQMHRELLVLPTRAAAVELAVTLQVRLGKAWLAALVSLSSR
jgi:hypothetical protein